MNPDDNTPQKPVTPPTDSTEEPTRPTPWVPSESDGTGNTDPSANDMTNNSSSGGAMDNDSFGSSSSASEPGPGMPEPPQAPTFGPTDAGAMPPAAGGPTPPPMPGAGPTGPMPPQPPMPPAPGQPGMPGGAPQFGAPVQPGMSNDATPLVPMPDGPQTQPAHATNPALMMGLLAVGVIIIIGFIVFLFLKK